jgi:hypothetical protein
MWTTEETVVKLFNFFAVLSVKLDKNSIRFSRLQLALNICKILFLFTFLIVIRKTGLIDFSNLIVLKQYRKETNFAYVVTRVSSFTINFVVYATLVLQSLKCKQVAKFLNELQKLPLGKRSRQILSRQLSTNFLIFGIYLALTSTITFGIFLNLRNVLSYVFFLSSAYQESTGFAFIVFVKYIEDTFVEHLKNIGEELETSFSRRNLERLSAKIDVISKLFDDFDKIFGAQWTFSTSSMTAVITVYVSTQSFNCCIYQH